MSTEKTRTTKQVRRPWWVAPGVGAVLGAGIIAIAAQGSLAAGHVALPSGPRLSPVPVAPAPVATTVPTGDGTVVAPVHAVVTQSAPSESSTGTAYHAGTSTSSAHPGSSTGGATATANEPGGDPTPPPATGASGDGPTANAEASSTATTPPRSPPTSTTTTTRPEREPGDG